MAGYCILGPYLNLHTVVSRKGPMGGVHYFVLRQGSGRIFVTSLHFITKKRPCLHFHNLQEDTAHQHTHPVKA